MTQAMTKDELTEREAQAWAGFEALISAIPEERLETPALAAGWSVKDVLWHVAFWWDDFVRAAADGWSELDEETDEVNEREYRRSRSMPVVEVRAELDEARERLLAAWAAADATDEAAEYFASETVEHYEEHEPQLRELAEDPHVKTRGE